MRMHRLAIALLLPACFNPRFGNTRCSTGDTCPSGLTCNSETRLCVAASGSATADAAAGSATADAASSSCWQAWLDHSVAITSVIPLLPAEQPGSDDRGPWISYDGYRLYYAHQDGDFAQLYFTSRVSLGDDFQPGMPVLGVSAPSASDVHPSLTMNEKMLAWSSNREGGNDDSYRTYVTVRDSPESEFPSPPPSPDVGAVPTDPFLNADGSRLYSNASSGDQSQIAVAAVTSLGSTLFMPQVLVDLSLHQPTRDPALSPDERVLVFSSLDLATTSWQLWYTTRTPGTDPSTQDYAPARKLLNVTNDTGHDTISPMLSSDGCKLYFSRVSTNENIPAPGDHGVGTLYVAAVSP